MSIAKPFTFVANTYAKASEVNADFDTVYSQVNTNISNIAQNATDIDNLENNKANINGSTAHRFAVADAISNGDAINKQSLMKAIGNSIGIISGFVITKDSGSPNDTILVYAGSCYDSTSSVVLSTSSNISKKNSPQSANSTYYVYVIGNATGSQTDILISTSSTTPTLPSGYTLFRNIGYFITDSSANIDYIGFYGINNAGNKATVAYTTKVYQNSKNGYIILSNNLCIQWGFVTTTNASNTVSLLKEYANTDYMVLTTLQLQDTGPYAQVVNTLTTSSFKTWETNANLGTGFWWLTIGYIS